MKVILSKSKIHSDNPVITITGSKSESNRLLLLQALFKGIQLENISNSDDTKVLQKALEISASSSVSNTVDIHHAGTAMRFLTAFFATQEHKETVLTGSERMQERPIKILVDALISLGADIEYLKDEGFPPLKINGKKIIKNEVFINANVSSQYLSALLLIGAKLENGLVLKLNGEITSLPYLKMTLSLLDKIGVETTFSNNIIQVKKKGESLGETIHLTVESDWSSASYFYSLVALSDVGTCVELNAFKEDSLQGDAALVDIYNSFGVTTTFTDKGIKLEKVAQSLESKTFDLNNTPDLAQTIAVTCLGLGISCKLTGLHTLKIKETDRLVALKIELEKLGGEVTIDENSLQLNECLDLNKGISIDTYKDHRMAMAFAPLCLNTDLAINNADVVSKSYPDFWKDLETLGLQLSHSK